jgi:predicted membrane protein
MLSVFRRKKTNANQAKTSKVEFDTNDYIEDISQPPEVKYALYICKICIIVCIPLGIVLSLFHWKYFFICFILCIILFVFMDILKNRKSNFKLSFVPLILITCGYIFGFFAVPHVLKQISILKGIFNGGR